jgi:hypothetical protein
LELLAGQIEAEGTQRPLFEATPRVALPGRGHCEPDDLDRSARLVVEVYARQGRADFGAHVHKIARDMLKLKMLTDTALSGYQPILLFTSGSAAASYQPGRKGWLARTCELYGIDVRTVELEPDLAAAIELAQERQDISRPLEA